MTNEEAIARIENHKIVHKMFEPRAIYISEALDMAIRALKNEQTDGDLISRQAVLDLCGTGKWLEEYRTEENGVKTRGYDTLKMINYTKLLKLPSYNSIKTELNEDLVKENTDLVKENTENADKKGVSEETVSQSLVKDGDLISRKAVLEIFEKHCSNSNKEHGYLKAWCDVKVLSTYPAEQTYEWCKGCKEYDTEKHCCHRYSSFIRESLQENINAVLEDIKAEIIDEQNNWIKGADAEWHECRRILQIIDNHISGKEKE